MAGALGGCVCVREGVGVAWFFRWRGVDGLEEGGGDVVGYFWGPGLGLVAVEVFGGWLVSYG